MSNLGKSINNSEYGGITIRWRQSCDKVNGDVQPGMARHRQGLKEPRLWLGTHLVPSTGRTGCKEGFDIRCHGGPPKMCLDQGEHAGRTWVPRQSVCVKPV